MVIEVVAKEEKNDAHSKYFYYGRMLWSICGDRSW